MTNKVRPITPAEASKQEEINFPNEVLEAFNELIAQNFVGKSATFGHFELAKLMLKKGLSAKAIYVNDWFNVEGIYRSAGWTVYYDRPGYNETYPARYTFTQR